MLTPAQVLTESQDEPVSKALTAAEEAAPQGAQVIVDVVLPHLSEQAHRDLHVLLGALQTFPSPAASRRRRLSVILDFMHVHGRRPTISEYSAAVQQRGEDGEDTPSLAQLYRWFGSWPKALLHAARYFEAGTAGRVASHRPTVRPRGSVTEQQLMDSIDRVATEIGYEPSDLEYFALLNAERLLRSKIGVGSVDLFSVTAFNSTFGSFGEGVAAARRRSAAKAVKTTRAEPATPTPRVRRQRSGRLSSPHSG